MLPFPKKRRELFEKSKKERMAKRSKEQEQKSKNQTLLPLKFQKTDTPTTKNDAIIAPKTESERKSEIVNFF